MAAACAPTTSTRSNAWPSSAPFPTGISSSTATSGISPSTATACSVACNRSLLEDHPLPGPAGRGAILLRLGEGEDAVAVVMMHLALGARVRTRQLAYIRELLSGYRHWC